MYPHRRSHWSGQNGIKPFRNLTSFSLSLCIFFFLFHSHSKQYSDFFLFSCFYSPLHILWRVDSRKNTSYVINNNNITFKWAFIEWVEEGFSLLQRNRVIYLCALCTLCVCVCEVYTFPYFRTPVLVYVLIPMFSKHNNF